MSSRAWSCWKTRFSAPSAMITMLWVKLHHQCYVQLLQHGAVSSCYLETQQMDCITSSNSPLKSGCWTEQEAPVQLETVTWFELKQSSFLHSPCSMHRGVSVLVHYQGIEMQNKCAFFFFLLSGSIELFSWSRAEVKYSVKNKPHKYKNIKETIACSGKFSHFLGIPQCHGSLWKVWSLWSL